MRNCVRERLISASQQCNHAQTVRLLIDSPSREHDETVRGASLLGEQLQTVVTQSQWQSGAEQRRGGEGNSGATTERRGREARWGSHSFERSDCACNDAAHACQRSLASKQRRIAARNSPVRGNQACVQRRRN